MIELTSPEEILTLPNCERIESKLSGKYKDDIIIKYRLNDEKHWYEFYYLYKLENGEYIQLNIVTTLDVFDEENKCFLKEVLQTNENEFETYIDTKIGEIHNDTVGM